MILVLFFLLGIHCEYNRYGWYSFLDYRLEMTWNDLGISWIDLSGYIDDVDNTHGGSFYLDLKMILYLRLWLI